MEDLFRSYWWLIFPLYGLAMGAWHSGMQYRRQKAMLDVIRTYADRGEQPPEAVLAALNKGVDDEDGFGSRGGRGGSRYWSLAALFFLLAATFAGVSYFGILGDGVGGPFYLVAAVMAAVGVWALINALIFGRPNRP